jgi:DNA adenine methylase
LDKAHLNSVTSSDTQSDGLVKKPLMRFHGGKWLLAPWILSHFPVHEIYLEPFGGAASVLLRKPRTHCEIYSDVDEATVNCLKVVRDYPALLIEQLRQIHYGKEALLQAMSQAECRIERAAQMIVLAHMGRATGSAASPWAVSLRGAGKQKRDMQREWCRKVDALWAASARLKGVYMLREDALSMIQKLDSWDTLIYIDPPYLPDTRGKGRDYRFEMSTYDHAHLLCLLLKLRSKVVISGYSSPLYAQYLDANGWQRYERGAFADSAQPRKEVIWTNFISKSAAVQKSGQLGQI